MGQRSSFMLLPHPSTNTQRNTTFHITISPSLPPSPPSPATPSPSLPQPTGQGLLCDVVDLDQIGPSAAADDTAGLVRRGVCFALDALRDDYDGLPDLMTRVRVAIVCV